MPDAAAIATRFALYVDLAALFGLAAFGLYALRARETEIASFAFRSALTVAALAALPLSIFGTLTLVAQMAGTPVSALDQATIEMFLLEMPVGNAALVRVAALLTALGAAGALFSGKVRPVISLWVALTTSGIALGSLAWGGHGAMGEGLSGWIHLGADIVHLLAAGAWIGALMALALLLFRPASRMAPSDLDLSHRALSGFGTAGTIMVALIVVSGLVNSWFLIGIDGIGTLFTTLYGQLLVIKLLLFGAMLCFAAANRFRLTPGLEQGIIDGETSVAVRALRRSLALETAAAAIILLLVSWIGMLSPPLIEG